MCVCNQYFPPAFLTESTIPESWGLSTRSSGIKDQENMEMQELEGEKLMFHSGAI